VTLIHVRFWNWKMRYNHHKKGYNFAFIKKNIVSYLWSEILASKAQTFPSDEFWLYYSLRRHFLSDFETENCAKTTISKATILFLCQNGARCIWRKLLASKAHKYIHIYMRETCTHEHHLFVMSVNLNLNLKGRAGDFHEMFLVFWSLNSLLC